MSKFKEMIRNRRPACIIAVGDTVTRNLESNRIFPKLSIIDNIVMRKSAKPFPLTAEKTIHTRNPPATITDEAITAIRDSMKSQNRIRIVVDGEEDLLTLIAVLCAPENALVVYGQPYKGIVVVEVTPAKKTEIAEILKAMENVCKAK
jgi:uncharacterized protein (UPF0218 family)